MQEIYDEQVGNIRISDYIQQKEEEFLLNFIKNEEGCNNMKIIEALRNEDGKTMIVSFKVGETRKLLSECKVEELKPIFKNIELVEDGTEYNMFKLDTVEVSNVIFNEIETHLFGCSAAYLVIESRIKDIVLSLKSNNTDNSAEEETTSNDGTNTVDVQTTKEDNTHNTEFKFDTSDLPNIDKKCSELGEIEIDSITQSNPNIDEDTFISLLNIIKDKYGLQLKVSENTIVTEGLSDGEFSNYVQQHILERVIERLNILENTNLKIVTSPKPNTVESNLSFNSPSFN